MAKTGFKNQKAANTQLIKITSAMLNTYKSIKYG